MNRTDLRRPLIGPDGELSAPRLPRLRRRAATLLRSAAELAGLGCIVGAAWTLSLGSGLLVLGLALILWANYGGGRSTGETDDPS